MLPEERANQAGELSAEDLEILGEIPPLGSTSSVAGEEEAAPNDGESKAGAEASKSGAASDKEVEGEAEETDPDPDDGEDGDEKDPDDPDGEDPDKDDKGDSQEDVEDEDLVLPDPEVVQEVTSNYNEAREAFLSRLADHYEPQVKHARTQYDSVMAEIKAIDDKYAKDEDGWAPPLDYQDVIKRQDLAKAAKEHETRLTQLANEIPQATAKIESELYIKTNVKAFPGLAKYEQGFRALIAQGVKFKSVEQAIVLSRTMQQTLGSDPKGKPQPSRTQVIKQVEEDRLKQRDAMKIGAGKKGGPAGKSSTTKKPYQGLSPKAQNDLKYFDSLMEV